VALKTPPAAMAADPERAGEYEAWAVRTDGSDLEALTTDSPHSVWFPRMSPDGSRLAYNNDLGSWMVNLQAGFDQREPVQLPGLGDDDDGFSGYAWTSDSSSILGAGDEGGVYLYSIATGSYTRLTESGYFPVWVESPDTLIYVDGEEDRIMFLDRSTGQPVPLDTGELEVSNWRWLHVAPDGKSLIYIVREEEADIWMAEFE